MLEEKLLVEFLKEYDYMKVYVVQVPASVDVTGEVLSQLEASYHSVPLIAYLMTYLASCKDTSRIQKFKVGYLFYLLDSC